MSTQDYHGLATGTHADMPVRLSSAHPSVQCNPLCVCARMSHLQQAGTFEDQDRFLKEAAQSVKKNAYFMRKAMDEDNLREALRYSAAMLGELRTSYLSPQRYYELYMQVFDELGNLEVRPTACHRVLLTLHAPTRRRPPSRPCAEADGFNALVHPACIPPLPPLSPAWWADGCECCR